MSKLFTPLERAAWGGLIVVHARLFAAIEEELRRRFRITHAEFEVLLRLALSPNGRLRLQQLAEQSLITRSGTSRAVERLTRAGHVERHGAAEDGRGAYAVLTASGRAHFFEAAEAHVALVRREFLGKLPAKEQERLAAIWARILAAPEEATPKRPAKKRTRGAPTKPRRAGDRSARRS
jgi:DNA-binding MarR family transcriptional regulator